MRGELAGFSKERSESAAPWLFWLQKGALNRNQIKNKSLRDFRPGKHFTAK